MYNMLLAPLCDYKIQKHFFCVCPTTVETKCYVFCAPGERMETPNQVVDRLRSAFCSGMTVSEQFRQTQLSSLLSMIKENEQLILDALHKDLAKVFYLFVYVCLSVTTFKAPVYVKRCKMKHLNNRPRNVLEHCMQ